MKIGEKKIRILRDTDVIPTAFADVKYDGIFFIITKPSGQSTKDVKTLSRKTDTKLYVCMLMPTSEKEVSDELAETLARYYLEP